MYNCSISPSSNHHNRRCHQACAAPHPRICSDRPNQPSVEEYNLPEMREQERNQKAWLHTRVCMLMYMCSSTDACLRWCKRSCCVERCQVIASSTSQKAWLHARVSHQACTHPQSAICATHVASGRQSVERKSSGWQSGRHT